MKKLIISIILGIFLISFISATCTLTFGKDIYFPGETVTATMSCGGGNEKTQAYTLNWTYENGTQLELDTGTTPTTASQNFFETYVIPSTWPVNIGLNATLQGTQLEGTDFANVTAGGANSLVITNIGLTSANDTRLGKTLGIEFEVDDENGKKVSNANCQIDIEDGIGNPLLSKLGVSHAGRVDAEFLLSPETFTEDRSYLIVLKCFCGSINNSKECIDEDGTAVTNSVGEDNSAFSILKWLTVNTVTDKAIYEAKNSLFICANISNAHNTRVPVHIYNQVRCSSGSDDNTDLDRTLVISDGNEYDQRGVSANTTQMQCKEFLIPEIRHLEGRNSQCYATTNTWVIDEKNNEIKGYSTTSSAFNVTSNTLNIPADWERISNYTFNTIINLSNTRYSDWNGSGTGNLDIVIDSTRGEIFDPRRTRSFPSISLESLFLSNQIKSITGLNSSGLEVTSVLEFLEDGKIEIELREIDISTNGYYNITLEFQDFGERQTEALEGINTKTGTFHLDVNCPSTTNLDQTMECNIVAQIEDTQIVQKEVDFTCYISDGVSTYSSVNFNQMVTRNPVTIARDFHVPSSIGSGSFVLQCHADYYNLGKRRDSFYDTFLTYTSGGGSSITGGVISEGEPTEEEKEDGEGKGIFGDIISKIGKIFKIPEITESKPLNLIIVGSILLLLIGGVTWGIIFFMGKRKKNPHYNPHDKFILNKTLKKIIVITITIASVVALILSVYYGSIFLVESLSNINLQESKTILDNSFSKLILLIGFITLIITFLFKVLNIQGEIRFGDTYPVRKYHEDRKSSKMQQKLNRMILKDEIKNVKKKRK